MSRSAEGATIIALLPPSSRIGRPKREATLGPTIEPIRVDPVAETIGTRFEEVSASPMAGPPMTSWARPSGASGPKRSMARSRIFIVASAESGVFSDGFQITGSPQTSASAAFQDQTATGKLKAEMIAHGPSGCQVSVMRWPGRSEAMARPYNWRERPTAKSQMSIISCTSPRPSETILPTSSVTSAPKAFFEARNSSPRRRTSSPRRGAGTSRQARKAFCARSMIAGMSAAGVSRMRAISAPSIGERTESEPPESAAAVRPKRSRMSPLVMGVASSAAICVSASGPEPWLRRPLFDPKSARPASPASPSAFQPKGSKCGVRSSPWSR